VNTGLDHVNVECGAANLQDYGGIFGNINEYIGIYRNIHSNFEQCRICDPSDKMRTISENIGISKHGTRSGQLG
jgi:hypothetical protein